MTQSTETVNLLPCPMCGSAARTSMTDNRKNQPFVYIVGCSKCPICMDWQQTKAEAITAWNARVSTNKDETIAKLREALDGMVRRHSASLQNWTQAAADAQQSGNRELCVSIQNTALTALSGFPLAQARAALNGGSDAE